ncbi:MAG: putative molybdenum carrier protein [Sphingomonadaceae bacterium]|nr:putative molybdenum carrier protein [Sphingomonadaceae bacterium]
MAGGQTGVDRAGLAFARAFGLPIAGWCPQGGWAEDLPHPPGVRALFPELVETPDRRPAERTRRNVALADRLVLVWPRGFASPGTALALAHARALGRPVTAVDPTDPAAAAQLAQALGAGGLVNLAGPRESEWPGAEAMAYALLERAWHSRSG